MEAFNFTVANEDCNLYSYDMRKLSVASCVHQVPSKKSACYLTFLQNNPFLGHQSLLAV